MNNIFRARVACKYLVGVLLMAGSAACEKAGFAYDNIIDENETNYSLMDTLTINMQTVLLDSVATSGRNTLLIGRHQDPYFGRISAHTYFQLQLPGDNILEDRAVYDSIALRLPTNRYVYGDTTLMQHFSVYRVTEDIKLKENNSYLWDHYTFATGSQPLGSLDKVLYPFKDTIVHISLDRTLGSTLFQLLKDRANEVSAQDQFIQYFKGLAVKPGNGSAAINGFTISDSLVMRLYYHVPALETEYKYRDFTLYNPSLQFNHVSTDRSGTLLSGLNDNNKKISSAQTNNIAFVQPLSSVAARIDIPALKNLAQLGKFFKIMRATLTVRPVAGSYVTPYSLPPYLTLCAADNLNRVTDTLYSPSTGVVQYGDLFIDNLYHLNTTYTYDITNYCIAEANSNDITSRGLLLMPPSGYSYTRFDRLVIGDKQNRAQQNRISIQLYYLVYTN